MISKIIYPSKRMRPFIQYFWVVDLDKNNIYRSLSQKIIPNGMSELIFHFGDRLKFEKNNLTDIMPKMILHGQTTNAYNISQTGNTNFIAAVFKPHSINLFFDIKSFEITNSYIDLSLLLNNEANLFFEQLSCINSNQTRIEFIESFLLKRLNQKQLFDFKRISQSIFNINKSFGQTTVSDLSKMSFLSEKQFYRKFLEYTGLTPKQFIKIVRIQYAVKLINTGCNNNLTELSLICGYYDQSHFIKDFKSIVGCTPKECGRTVTLFSDYF